MNFALNVADRVCYLEGGVIVEDGPTRQVLTEPAQAATRRFLARTLER